MPRSLPGVAVAHQQLAQALPPDMVAAQRWVAWRYQQRGQKRTKVPVGALGLPLDATHATNCTGLLGALSWCAERACDGVGFALGDGYVGVDLDHCRDPVTGHVEAWAQAVVAQVHSYTEASPSGTGVHVITRGHLPPGRRRKGDLEMYDSGRFFTVTGDHMAGSPSALKERTEELAALHAETFPPKAARAAQPVPRVALGMTDAEVLRLAFKAKNGARVRALYGGDTAAYGGDASSADAALLSVLAFWTQDEAQLDRLFRSSGLHREKWERPDYRERTLRFALENRTEHYDPTRRYRPVDTPDAGPEDAPAAPGATDAPEDLHLGDRLNARMFAQKFAGRLRYAGKAWWWYGGVRWAEDDTGEAMRCAREIPRHWWRLGDPANTAVDSAQRKQHLDWALKSEDAHRLQKLLTLGQSEPALAARVEAFDQHTGLLNTPNGTVDIRTGCVMPHDHRRLLTHCTAALYDPHARSAAWDAFLAATLPDGGVQRFVQKALGYALLGNPTEDLVLVGHGPTRTGKTTLVAAIGAALGSYHQTADIDSLAQRQTGSGPRPELVRLRGARLVTTSELNRGVKLDVSLLKRLSGGDSITARGMYTAPVTFRPEFTVFIVGNERPNVPADDDAIWERLREIPFEQRRPEDQRDTNLRTVLADADVTGPAVLGWLIEGAQRYLAEGLRAPAAVLRASADYRTEMNPLTDFVEACIVNDAEARTASSALWLSYLHWRDTSGERHGLGRKGFAQAMKALGYEQDHDSAHSWIGIAV